MKKKDIIETIYEDNNLLVISKPAGLLTIPDRYNKDIENLRQIFVEKYGQIFVVHRLDKDTSGTMVFAKDADTHRDLNTQFENTTVKKVYHCVVSGLINKDEIEIDIPLMTDPANPGKTIPSARGKESLTLLKVIKRFRNSTLVKCLLVTGRHHQIRAHCAAIGFPLLIDPMYNNTHEFLLSKIKKKFNLKKHDIEKPIISRITMHSKILGFHHPGINEDVEYESNYPKDFAALVQVLEKYSSVPDYYTL